MSHYFAYYNSKPVVFCDDGMGFVHVSHKNRITIRAAHGIAKVWNAHEQKRGNKKSPDTIKHRGTTHEESNRKQRF